MSLLGEVPRDRSGRQRGDDWKPAPAALTGLAKALAPKVVYDFSGRGPVTDKKSFAGRRNVFAIVLDRDSTADVDTIQGAIEGFQLGYRVIILRSCTTRSALAQLRPQVNAQADLLRVTSMAASISAARGVVAVTVYPPRAAKVLRSHFGDRVEVDVGQVFLS